MLQVWKLSATDLCEIARNSVTHSGFPHQVGALICGGIAARAFARSAASAELSMDLGAFLFWNTTAACTMLMLDSQGC